MFLSGFSPPPQTAELETFHNAIHKLNHGEMQIKIKLTEVMKFMQQQIALL